jgi:hypothetical protein
MVVISPLMGVTRGAEATGIETGYHVKGVIAYGVVHKKSTYNLCNVVTKKDESPRDLSSLPITTQRGTFDDPR